MEDKSLEDRIRERAYALWESDGKPDGRADQYWEIARQEMEAEETRMNGSAKPPGLVTTASASTS
jgi:hypothetical protein